MRRDYSMCVLETVDALPPENMPKNTAASYEPPLMCGTPDHLTGTLLAAIVDQG